MTLLLARATTPEAACSAGTFVGSSLVEARTTWRRFYFGPVPLSSSSLTFSLSFLFVSNASFKLCRCVRSDGQLPPLPAASAAASDRREQVARLRVPDGDDGARAAVRLQHRRGVHEPSIALVALVILVRICHIE